MKASQFLIAFIAGSATACAATHDHAGGCAAHRQAMAGKTPAEQRAAAEEHIRAMHGSADAAHVERHLQMMEQHCGPG